MPIEHVPFYSIETSALDASNVENAFQTILTGQSPLCRPLFRSLLQTHLGRMNHKFTEIYRIVSSKQLEADPISSRPGQGSSIEITPSSNDGGQPAGSKCC